MGVDVDNDEGWVCLLALSCMRARFTPGPRGSCVGVGRGHQHLLVVHLVHLHTPPSDALVDKIYLPSHPPGKRLLSSHNLRILSCPPHSGQRAKRCEVQTNTEPAWRARHLSWTLRTLTLPARGCSIPKSGYNAMSMIDQLPQERAVAGHPSKGPEPVRTYTRSDETYDDTIFDDFYTADNQKALATEAQKSQRKMDAPVLPEKSSLRASRLLDNLNLKFPESVKTTELSQATPHDIYLSSEEDASSSADDFSDYEFESDSEDPESPRRTSYEVMARVVSVVYMGKPSIIDLPASRRSISPNSIEARRRASTVSSMSPYIQRSATPTESATSSIHQQSPRKNSLMSSLLSKKKPPFLNIDPYANGSTYSLEPAPAKQYTEDDTVKTPRTPTVLLKNMSRTLSLVRKRSRPVLNTNALQKNITYENRPESPAPPARARTEPINAMSQAPLPSPPVTYNDIIQAAKKNSMMAPPQPSPVLEHPEPSPITPTTSSKRGILSGLAARRRSIKLTGRVI